MTRFVLLDAGPLGQLSNPRAVPGMRAWFDRLNAAGVVVAVPEIADYEVRRELLRAGKARGLARLDALAEATVYLPLSTAIMRRAAELWAQARRGGRPTAPDAALDGDVILAALAQLLTDDGHTVMIATENVGHLAAFADARPWNTIEPPNGSEP